MLKSPHIITSAEITSSVDGHFKACPPKTTLRQACVYNYPARFELTFTGLSSRFRCTFYDSELFV